MASIAGLTERQCVPITALRVGDLVLIKRGLPLVEETHVEDDEEADDDDDDDDGDYSVDEDDGGDDEDEQNDDDGDDEEGAASGDPDDVDGEIEPVDQSTFSATIYLVLAVTKDSNNITVDLKLAERRYSLKPGENAPHSFQVYGSEVVYDKTIDGVAPTTNLTDIAANPAKFNPDSIIRDRCTGYQIYKYAFDRQCPAACLDGWLPNQQALRNLIKETPRPLPGYQPVCPVCLGKDLALELHMLREFTETGTPVDLGLVVEFYGRLNPLRRRLGYRFQQFDEREWGYLFDDMQDGVQNVGQGAANAGHSGWAYYSEALDPSAGVLPKPASEAVVKNLPRNHFAQAKKESECTLCQICREPFKDATVVATLPCGHFFCDEGCTEMWLKQSATCPTCRYKLPLKEDEGKGQSSEDKVMGEEDEEDDDDYESDEDCEDDDGSEIEDDDPDSYDVEMLDV